MSATAFPDFAWASGEECSTPLVPFGGSVVRVDQLASTGHLDRMDDDCTQAAALGIDAWRYGMPWYRSEPAPGRYDWSLWDRALAACDRVGLRPVVDLCHFGLPDHHPGFCDPAWVDGFVRYAEAFLARYPEPVWFTPVNEPVVTAAMSAMEGAWNDARRDPADWARAAAHCVLADLEVAARVRDDRDGWNVCAEGIPVAVVRDEARREEADLLTGGWQAVWDLRLGHALEPGWAALFDAAVDGRVLARIEALAGRVNVVAGHDLYPVSVIPYGDGPDLSIDDRLDAYEVVARAFHDRYGIDFWIAETSNLGLPVAEGPAWLEALGDRLGRLRAAGLPVRGLCWYSRGDQHDWDSSLTRPVGSVTEVGLADIDRRERPVAAAFRRLAAAGPPD